VFILADWQVKIFFGKLSVANVMIRREAAQFEFGAGGGGGRGGGRKRVQPQVVAEAHECT